MAFLELVDHELAKHEPLSARDYLVGTLARAFCLFRPASSLLLGPQARLLHQQRQVWCNSLNCPSNSLVLSILLYLESEVSPDLSRGRICQRQCCRWGSTAWRPLEERQNRPAAWS